MILPARATQSTAEVYGPRIAPLNPACPDCPAVQAGVFEKLLPHGLAPCMLRSVALSPRQTIPESWFHDYGVGLVRRGAIIRQRYDRHGRAVAVDAIGPGGLVPLTQGSGSSAACTGYAATGVLACLVTSSELALLLEASPAVAHDLLRLQAQALDRVERLADARGRATVIERVTALLCALFDTMSPGRSGDLPVDLQQRDLAALCATRHESVCRALRQLSNRGLVMRTPDGLRLVDRERLETF